MISAVIGVALCSSLCILVPSNTDCKSFGLFIEATSIVPLSSCPETGEFSYFGQKMDKPGGSFSILKPQISGMTTFDFFILRFAPKAHLCAILFGASPPKRWRACAFAGKTYFQQPARNPSTSPSPMSLCQFALEIPVSREV